MSLMKSFIYLWDAKILIYILTNFFILNMEYLLFFQNKIANEILYICCFCVIWVEDQQLHLILNYWSGDILNRMGKCSLYVSRLINFRVSVEVVYEIDVLKWDKLHTIQPLTQLVLYTVKSHESTWLCINWVSTDKSGLWYKTLLPFTTVW